MTIKDTERLARLETQMTALFGEVQRGRNEIGELNKKFDELAGGKQALMYITGIFLTCAGITVAALNLLKKK